jgi:class 3 adenylate cyclase
MELAEQLDPEQWHGILDRFFQILTEGVHRFEGTVNQYTGDGIMALFGAPIAHEDHAQRACHAALYLRDELGRYATTVRREHGADFATRMGLNSGEVIVGKIGDDLRMDYTAQGHTVGLAQRMEALAADGKPYLTETTAKLVEGFFELEDLGEFNVKGASHPVRVFALRDTGAARTRVDRPARSGLSRFVGRDDELASLMAAFDDADVGRGQVVGIVAGPGLGKSRLAREFVNRVRAAGAYAVEVHCPSHGKQVPFIAYLDLVRNTFRVAERDDQATIRAKIKDRFDNAYPELIELMPLICDFLGAPDPEQPLPPMTPEQRQKRLLEWQQRALRARDRRRECVVYLFEDMHWVDAASEKLIDALAQITPSLRHLVLMTYRPEYAPPCVSTSFYRQLPLLSLTDSAMGDLLEGLLGPEVAGSDLARMIRERCGGTPFFVEEMIQSLAEAEFLEGERGAYTLAKPIAEIPLPGTVQAVLAARIDRLPERAKLLLQTASVIDRVFPREVLCAVMGDAIDDGLSTLMDAELVFEESVYPEVDYAFKHALVQDVAYASQLTGRREELHRLVADAFERHYANQLDAKAALVARHREAGGEPLVAAEWLVRAARWISASDLITAREHWSQAKRLLDASPSSAERDARLVDCHYELLWILDRTGASLAECQALYEQGRDLARRAGDRRAEASIEASYGWINTTHRKWDVARRASEAAIALADAEGYLPAQLFARFTLQRVLIWHGSLAECARLGEEAIRLTDEETGRPLELAGFPVYLAVLCFRALGYAWSGEPVKGSALHREMIELSRRPGLRVNTSGLVGDDVYNCWLLGDGDLALERAEEALQLADRFGAPFYIVHALLKKGIANALVCRWSEARRFLEQGGAVMRETGAGVEYESLYHGYAALCLAALGEDQEALERAERATRTAADDGPYCLSVQTGCLRARVLRMVGGVERAEELAAQVVDTLEAIACAEMESWRPLILLERAGLHQLTGDADAAARDLGEASELFHEYARSIEA